MAAALMAARWTLSALTAVRAALSTSPVRMRITRSIGCTKIFPSPTSPVRAAARMACTQGSTNGSEHTISILTFSWNSMTSAVPRYCSNRSCSPPCPLTRLRVMPVIPARNSAALTSGRRSGRTIVVMSFMGGSGCVAECCEAQEGCRPGQTKSPLRGSGLVSSDQDRFQDRHLFPDLRLRRIFRLLVAEDLAGVVPQYDFLVRQLHDVLGQQRDLAAAARGVDDEVRHREPAGPAAQALDDLQPLLDCGAEVLGAGHLVAHVDVVGPHPRREQLLHQLLHHLDVVVDAFEQHRLAAQGDAGVGEAAERFYRGGRQLAWVVEVRVDVQRMVLPQDVAQLRRDALGEVARHPAADAQDLEVRDGAQPPADFVNAAVGE